MPDPIGQPGATPQARLQALPRLFFRRINPFTDGAFAQVRRDNGTELELPYIATISGRTVYLFFDGPMTPAERKTHNGTIIDFNN